MGEIVRPQAEPHTTSCSDSISTTEKGGQQAPEQVGQTFRTQAAPDAITGSANSCISEGVGGQGQQTSQGESCCDEMPCDEEADLGWQLPRHQTRKAKKKASKEDPKENPKEDLMKKNSKADSKETSREALKKKDSKKAAKPKKTASKASDDTQPAQAANGTGAASSDAGRPMTCREQDAMMAMLMQAEADSTARWEDAYAWWSTVSADSPIEFIDEAVALPGHPQRELAVKLVRGAFALRRT